MSKFKAGDKVHKSSGRYNFRGEVLAVFKNLSGDTRLVAENQDGIIHIFSENNLDYAPRMNEGFRAPDLSE